MYSTRLIKLLLVALSVFAVAQATYIDVKIIDEQSRSIVRRQNDNTDVTADATDSSSSTTEISKTTTTKPTSSIETPTETPTTSETTSKTTPTSKPTSSTEKPPSSTVPPKTSSTTTPETTSKPSSSVPMSTITHVVTRTNDDGSKSTFVSETTAAPTAGLQDDSGKKSSSGMSTSTRNIVIGVVVGVGGAIVLGGIGLVAWRIWGRKKSQNEDADMDFDTGTGYQPMEKPDTPNPGPSGRSPFQSTLESYHAPTQVNTASNF